MPAEYLPSGNNQCSQLNRRPDIAQFPACFTGLLTGIMPATLLIGPPKGGHYVPPRGGHYVPPKGGHYVPPKSGHYVPPKGGHYVPPKGEHYVPPRGGHYV